MTASAKDKAQDIVHAAYVHNYCMHMQPVTLHACLRPDHPNACNSVALQGIAGAKAAPH